MAHKASRAAVTAECIEAVIITSGATSPVAQLVLQEQETATTKRPQIDGHKEERELPNERLIPPLTFERESPGVRRNQLVNLVRTP